MCRKMDKARPRIGITVYLTETWATMANSRSIYSQHNFKMNVFTTPLAGIERPLSEREVVGSNPGYHKWYEQLAYKGAVLGR